MTAASTVLRGERKSAIRAVVDGRVRMIRDDYSGAINGVDVRLLLDALSGGLRAGRSTVAPPAMTAC
ncbi:MAG: hypothetical protein U0521_02780 [Anaerolineae bacterium]